MLYHSGEFSPKGSGEAILAAGLRAALRYLLRPVWSPRFAIPTQRFWARQVARTTWVPWGARFTPATIAGVAGEWVRPKQSAGSSPGRTTILYLHGGAYCVGSRLTHRSLTGHLALATGLPIFVADYRLAPEHPFPAAGDDAAAVFGELQKSGPVVLAGDSAGGGLAVATALALRDRHVAAPAALVLFSPWVDLSTPRLPTEEPQGEALLSVDWLAACTQLYLGQADAKDPRASPIFADLRGLPPTLIQAGTDELLYRDALRLHQAMEAAGVAVTCEIIPRRWHVFQLHAGVLPSANAALSRVHDFLAVKVSSR